MSSADKTGILSYWPMKGSDPRKTQVEVLRWIEGLPSHIRYILLEVPVGGGKSPLAINLSAWLAQGLGSSTILTPQKILQKQYEDSFEPHLVGSMYGKGNYECKPKRTNCDVGDSIRPKCPVCPHKIAFNAAKAKPNVVLNYKIALLFSAIGVEFIRQRKLMVMDECHNLENQLVEFLAVTVSQYMCKRYNVTWRKPKDMKDALNFLSERYLPGLMNEVTRVGIQVKEIHAKAEAGETLSKSEGELIREFEEMKEQHARLSAIVATPMEELLEHYVYVPDNTFFKFKELYGARIFKSLINPLADKFLFMSSTILDKDEFCKDLGIDPAQAAFISMDSEFPVDNRPVMFMPTMKMTYGWDGPDKKAERDHMIETIVDLCKDNHPDDNGVIHTGSFAVANWLVKELTGKIPHRIYHHDKDGDLSRDECIKQFTNGDSQRKLLISPSVTEGLDLKGDLARFNIIAKTPFPFLGDAWVKARMEKSQAWYNRQAMIAIIQACGRVVRGKEDWGYTYILDSAFIMLYQRILRNIPKWWKAGFHKD